MKRSNRGSWTLIGLLVAVAVVGAIIYFVAGRGGVTTVQSDSPLLNKGSDKQTTIGKSLDTAKGTDCQAHLANIRTGINNYKISSEDRNPPALKDVGLGVGEDYFKCPVTSQAYIYDPAAGTVRCPSPGHEKF